MISFLYFQLDAWLYDRYQEDFSNINLFWVNAIQTECKLSANVLNKSFYCLVNVTGFIEHLEIWKSWNLPSNFPDSEKVWKIGIKSRKVLKSLEFLFSSKLQQVLYKKIFFILSNLFQSRPIFEVHENIHVALQNKLCSCMFLRSVLIACLITLSLYSHSLYTLKFHTCGPHIHNFIPRLSTKWIEAT